jgi:hypothetical protein
MHPSLPLQPLHGSASLVTRKLLDYILQLRVFLANNLFQLHRYHPGFLELGKWPSGFNGLMLPCVSD